MNRFETCSIILPMIIDFHTHIFPPRIRDNRSEYASNDSCFASLYSSPKARIITAEQLIASMDEAEIDISVVLNYGWSTHELCVETNGYIIESMARYPDRLVGFGAVQPGSPEASGEIERCVRGGIKGIGELRPDLQAFDLMGDEIMRPLIDLIRKHRLILLMHASEPVGHIYPGKGTMTPRVVYPFISKYPDLTLVLAHWGGGLPFYALMPEVRKAMSNTFFDTAASPFLYSPQIYTRVSEIVGADHILFGTDFPLLKQSRLLKEISSLDLPETASRLILAGNALKLLGIRQENRV